MKNTPKNISGWTLLSVGDIFTFVKSYAFSRDNLIDGYINYDQIGNIHYGDIHSTYTSLSINLNNVPIPLIKDENFVPNEKDYLKDGDLIMADASEDYNGVGVTVSIHGLGEKKVIGGLHTLILRDCKNKTQEYFRQYIFRNPNIRNELQKVANGVSVYGISKAAVSKVLIPLPSLLEQKRIVAVLETWDRVIEKLAKKIGIQKQIKKGLMQELLTGKTRLSGYTGSWTETTLGNVMVFVNGYTFKSSTYRENGKYKIVTIANVQDGFMQINDDTKKIVELPDNISKEQILSVGNILISMTGNVGRICRVDQNDCLLNQRVGKIIPKNINPKMLFAFLRDKKFLSTMVEKAQGGAQDNLSTEDIKDYHLMIPETKEEQSAIADIIDLADKEILVLKNQLSLIEGQKKYLLNNLIIGTMRTPESLC